VPGFHGRLYRDDAVVLRVQKLGESDRIITLFTRRHGRVRAVAKGVRRTMSKFGARLEPFGHVDVQIAEGHSLHVVSQVEGKLRGGLTAMDAFRATFPAGTLTGAPKVRAMEIIDELEPERRGPYGGALGYIAAGARRMDLAITIRTCVIAHGVASVQAAAGIVYDSMPERELLETQNKARALLTAIGQVRGL